jgi:hypothetical protein
VIVPQNLFAANFGGEELAPDYKLTRSASKSFLQRNFAALPLEIGEHARISQYFLHKPDWRDWREWTARWRWEILGLVSVLSWKTIFGADYLIIAVRYTY